MKRGIWWTLVGVVIVVAGGWWYFSSSDGEASDFGIERRAVSRRGDLVVSVSATGVVDPIELVEVKSKASGEIITLPIVEGDFVKRGDLIARLDRTTAQNFFDQAEADLSVAKATLQQREREQQRIQKLVDQKLATPDELDQALLATEQAKAQLVRATASLSTAKEQLHDTEIRAPIDGIVLTRPVEVGQVISSGTTTVTGGTLLCTVANMSEVYVVTDVDETDIGRVVPGLEATIEPDAYPDMRLEGAVLRVAPMAKVTQNVTVFEVTILVDNSKYLLKAGMNATVETIIDKAEDVVIVPTRAVQMQSRDVFGEADNRMPDSMRTERMRNAGARGNRERPQGAEGGARPAWGRQNMVPAVQVIRDGQPQWQRVRPGLSNFEDVEIKQGLAEGDTLVYSLTSGAMQARADFRDRMRSRSSVPGMR